METTIARTEENDRGAEDMGTGRCKNVPDRWAGSARLGWVGVNRDPCGGELAGSGGAQKKAGLQLLLDPLAFEVGSPRRDQPPASRRRQQVPAGGVVAGATDR